jgi:hypothetical protein
VPPRYSDQSSVACSAGGLRKERGYAWGVSGREGVGKKARSVATYKSSQLRCPSPAPGRTGSVPSPRRGAGRRASGTQERAVDAVIPRSGRGWQRRLPHVARDLQVLLVVEVELREAVGRVGRGEVVAQGAVGAPTLTD